MYICGTPRAFRSFYRKTIQAKRIMESKNNMPSGTSNNLSSFISKYGRRISRGLLVAICIGLIAYFMPKEKSVHYDFKSDTPWTHEQIRAEFDFDVPKSKEEISAEEDSVKKQFIPIFQQIGKAESSCNGKQNG